MGVGKNLKRILKEKNITIAKLAEMTNISKNTLYAITKRDSFNVRQDNIKKIAEALDISTLDLVYSDVSEWPKENIKIALHPSGDAHVVIPEREMSNQERLYWKLLDDWMNSKSEDHLIDYFYGAVGDDNDRAETLRMIDCTLTDKIITSLDNFNVIGKYKISKYIDSLDQLQVYSCYRRSLLLKKLYNLKDYNIKKAPKKLRKKVLSWDKRK